MSVWKSACYKDDAFQFMARNVTATPDSFAAIKQFLNFDTDQDGQLNEHVSLTPGNVKDQIADNMVVWFTPNPAATASKSLTATIKSHQNFRFGLDAVYTFINHIYPRAWTHGLAKDHDASLECDIFMAGLTGGGHSKGDIDLRRPELVDTFTKDILPIRFIIKALHHAAAGHKQRSYFRESRVAELSGDPLIPIKSELNRFFVMHSIYCYRGCVLIADPQMKYSLFLMQKDLDRIEKFLLGAAHARSYAKLYGMLEKDARFRLVRGVIKWQDMAVKAMADLPKERMNLLCRTFDVAYFVHLAKYGSDVDDEPLELQLAKYERECLHKELPLRNIQAIVEKLPFKDSLEVLQQYKLFPAPDFDSYSMLAKQDAMYKKYAPMFENVRDSEHYEGIMLYHRWFMIVAFHNRHGKCPGDVREMVDEKHWHKTYPYVDPKTINFRETGDIDFNGEFVYNLRENDCLDLVKDKAICPEDVKYLKNTRELNRLDVRHKSQLVDILTRSALPNVSHLRENFLQLNLDMKCDDKPEAKKPNGRLFFEAGSDARLCLSEYEDSNAEYAKFFPGATVGLDTSAVKKAVNKASAPGRDNASHQPLYISFDLEKFSPAFNWRVSADLDAAWAEAYGIPEVANYHNVLKDGQLHYIKGNFHHVIDKQGSDFEGFFGRRNTMYHCAVMGYTVNYLRRVNLSEGGVNFASLIDDGLLRMMIPSGKMRELVPQIKRTIEKIYRHGSLIISWDKTFVSGRMCVFLNEVRTFGRSITPGMKAILRISNRSDDLCPSLVSDLMLVASTARGAITAGATPVATYAMYAICSADAIKRWSNHTGPSNIVNALRFFLPPKLGGLGLVGLMALAGSLIHDDFVESLGVLRAMGLRFPMLQEKINQLLKFDAYELVGDASFTAPTKIKAKLPTVSGDRGYQKVKHYLLYRANLPAIEKHISFLRGDSDVREQRMPLAPAKLVVEVRERIWSSSPYHLVDNVVAKFLKSSSAMSFVPRRVFFRTMIANKTEAMKYFKANGHSK